ncbi:MAG: hypothetical protein KC420_18075, partial [Myxococcales bacterium]|nr:hypothetical protein [Myxococcales bacterium]
MRRISLPLLATVALAFGCASSNSQSNVQNPEDAGQVQYDVGSDGADGGDADAGAAEGGGSKRKPKDQMGTSGADTPAKAVKKLAATKPPRPDEPAAEPKTKPKRTGRTTPHGLLAQFYGIDAGTDALPDFASLGDAASASIVENLE